MPIIIVLLVIIIIILCPYILVVIAAVFGIALVELYDYLKIVGVIVLVFLPFLIYSGWKEGKKDDEEAKRSNKIPKSRIDAFKLAISTGNIDVKELLKRSLKTDDVPEYIEDLTYDESEMVITYIQSLKLKTYDDLSKHGLKKNYTGEKTRIL